MDSLVNLNRWHRWNELFDYAHLVVAARPGWAQAQIVDEELKCCVEQRAISVERFKETDASSGHVVFCRPLMVDIASTDIRNRLLAGEDARQIKELNERVGNYIHSHGLYR
jgi:nicotinate-nucleotide adenylyltransferase